jgi:arylsulfatase A-like enzyme
MTHPKDATMNPVSWHSWLRWAILALSLGLSPAAAGAAQAESKQPNIVVILADDIGYGDLGCYGATRVQTPNLDRLARQGMRFTDAHAPSAVCTPTRYALMTGQYAWRHPPGSRILSGVAPPAIKPGTVTVPALLKQAGYTTGCVGKWHLGLGEGQTDYNGPITPGPHEVGFDYSFIIPATGDRVPCVYVENQRVVGYDPQDPIRVSYGTPVGDEPTGAKNPELLKLPASAGHNNTIINGIGRIGYMTGGKAARWRDEDMADTLTSKAVAFLEKNQEKPFFLYFATHDIHVPRVPHPRFRGTSQCGVRGDVIQELDWSVGQVMAALDRLNLTDRTLLIFSSDNGGVMDDGYADGAVRDANGHRCNGPLRAFKGSLYEGGTREPFIARWPGKVPAGKTSGEIVCLVDLLATLAAVAGKEVPAGAGPDSFNQLPALLAEKPERVCRDHVVLHGGGGQLAIRKGPWKLIGEPGGRGGRAAELYNLAADLAESQNLAATEPDKVNELAALLRQIRESGRSPNVGR